MLPIDFAERMGLAQGYIANMEKGISVTPNHRDLVRMAKVLKLDENEKTLMFELAEKSKEERQRTSSTPILDYIDANASVREALRTARDLGATEADWEEFTQKIKKQKAERNEI